MNIYDAFKILINKYNNIWEQIKKYNLKSEQIQFIILTSFKYKKFVQFHTKLNDYCLILYQKQFFIKNKQKQKNNDKIANI